jgi:type I restriction enzyme S subunit
MKKYDSYKDSGIDWIGEIPMGWSNNKIKYCSTCNDDVLPENIDGSFLIKYVEIGDVNSVNGITNITDYKFKEAPSRARRITQKGDVIISTVRTYLKAVARISKKGLIVSTGFAVLRPKGINDRFLSFTVLSENFIDEVISLSSGVSYPAINASNLIDIKIPVPPLSEQEAIANYLDYETGKIDEVIAEKEKLVQQLLEYRTSVITEAVTHGLNPDAKMKNSGIDWIGEIPEHWEIIKVSHLFDEIGSGITPKSDNINYYSNSGNYWLQTGDLNDGIIEDTSKKLAPLAFSNYNLRIFPKRSLVIAMYGATIGKIGLLNIETATNQACCVLPPNNNMVIRYCFYIFLASRQCLINSAFGGGQPNISQLIIKNHKISVPPLSEQKTIANYLDEKTSKIDDTIKELQSQIEDLKSYRTSIISEAVTGKVDVRDWKKTT